MPTIGHLRILFGVFALFGGLRTFRLLAIRRRAAQNVHALHEWSEKPLSSWRYEPFSAGAILIHALALSTLGLAVLGAASNPSAFNDRFVGNDFNTIVLSWIAEGGSISLVGYLLGSVFAFPLASLRKSPIACAITEEGVMHGRTQMRWHWFSHFTIDRTQGLLSLHSAFSPDMSSVVLKPSSSGLLREIGNTLRAYLPDEPGSSRRAWYRTKHLLIPAMVLVCLPLVAAGWLAAYLPRELAMFMIAASTAILFLLGGRVVMLFGFGLLRIRADPSQRPPTA